MLTIDLVNKLFSGLKHINYFTFREQMFTDASPSYFTYKWELFQKSPIEFWFDLDDEGQQQFVKLLNSMLIRFEYRSKFGLEFDNW